MSIDMNVVSQTRTICEVLREINDLAKMNSQADLQELVMEAMVMAKKMSTKLSEYKTQAELDKDLKPGINHNYFKSKERRKVGTD